MCIILNYSLRYASFAIMSSCSDVGVGADTGAATGAGVGDDSGADTGADTGDYTCIFDEYEPCKKRIVNVNLRNNFYIWEIIESTNTFGTRRFQLNVTYNYGANCNYPLDDKYPDDISDITADFGLYPGCVIMVVLEDTDDEKIELATQGFFSRTDDYKSFSVFDTRLSIKHQQWTYIRQ